MLRLVEAASSDLDLIHQFQQNWKVHILTASVQAHINISNSYEKTKMSLIQFPESNPLGKMRHGELSTMWYACLQVSFKGWSKIFKYILSNTVYVWSELMYRNLFSTVLLFWTEIHPVVQDAQKAMHHLWTGYCFVIVSNFYLHLPVKAGALKRLLNWQSYRSNHTSWFKILLQSLLLEFHTKSQISIVSIDSVQELIQVSDPSIFR